MKLEFNYEDFGEILIRIESGRYWADAATYCLVVKKDEDEIMGYGEDINEAFRALTKSINSFYYQKEKRR